METSTVATVATPSAPAIPTDASIAVLPFVNMSGNPSDEYFSDGLAEELLNSLARIDGLKVAARTASFQYKNRSGDVAAIAQQLRVAHVLEGSVRRSGSRVRVTAQLIKASNGYHLGPRVTTGSSKTSSKSNRTSRAESPRSCVSTCSRDRPRATPRHSICCCGPVT